MPERPWEAVYSSAERTPRLLSEVLASVARVHKIDLLPETFLSTIRKHALGNVDLELGKQIERNYGYSYPAPVDMTLLFTWPYSI